MRAWACSRITLGHLAGALTDGPFAESKELIGGFAVLELSGIEEAIDVCKSYAEILGGTLEIDLRLVAPPDAKT